jgi:RecJ-like exonuclease
MTDRLPCPDCSGSGEKAFGPMTVLCPFCRGRGYVGDDNEPAERNQEPADNIDPRAATPIWDDPGARGLSGCKVCLGTGRVINLGGDVRGGTPSTMVEAPCPACTLPTGEQRES